MSDQPTTLDEANRDLATSELLASAQRDAAHLFRDEKIDRAEIAVLFAEIDWLAKVVAFQTDRHADEIKAIAYKHAYDALKVEWDLSALPVPE